MKKKSCKVEKEFRGEREIERCAGVQQNKTHQLQLITAARLLAGRQHKDNFHVWNKREKVKTNK